MLDAPLTRQGPYLRRLDELEDQLRQARRAEESQRAAQVRNQGSRSGPSLSDYANPNYMRNYFSSPYSAAGGRSRFPTSLSPAPQLDNINYRNYQPTLQGTAVRPSRPPDVAGNVTQRPAFTSPFSASNTASALARIGVGGLGAWASCPEALALGALSAGAAATGYGIGPAIGIAGLGLLPAAECVGGILTAGSGAADLLGFPRVADALNIDVPSWDTAGQAISDSLQRDNSGYTFRNPLSRPPGVIGPAPDEPVIGGPARIDVSGQVAPPDWSLPYDPSLNRFPPVDPNDYIVRPQGPILMPFKGDMEDEADDESTKTSSGTSGTDYEVQEKSATMTNESESESKHEIAEATPAPPPHSVAAQPEHSTDASAKAEETEHEPAPKAVTEFIDEFRWSEGGESQSKLAGDMTMFQNLSFDQLSNGRFPADRPLPPGSHGDIRNMRPRPGLTESELALRKRVCQGAAAVVLQNHLGGLSFLPND